MYIEPPDSSDITFLRIEHYSGHPDVTKAADVLVGYVSDSKQFIKDQQAWNSAARKLVASLWIRSSDSFRFNTKKDYFSKGSRKQAWLTTKTLQLFKAAQELNWVVKIPGERDPKISIKKQGGMATIYARTDTFKHLLAKLSKGEIEPDKELPWVLIKDKDKNLLDLPYDYLMSHGYRRTVAVLANHHQLLMSKKIFLVSSKKSARIDPLSIRYQRRWTGKAGIGGRFYSPFCNFSKTDRFSITIEGERVGCWDFSQLHPNLLLLMKHGQSEEPTLFSPRDIYDMPDFPHLNRLANKVLINTILNAESREAAARSISTAHYY